MSGHGRESDGPSPPTQHNDSVVFASALVEQVNKEDIRSMVCIQREILSRFEKTNEMLINFNILSTGRYEATVKDFSKHTKLLYDMKKDLDNIFKRIRTLKQRLGTSYPEAFAACNSVYDVPDEEEEDSEYEDIQMPAGKETLQVPTGGGQDGRQSGTEQSHRKEDNDNL